MKTINMINEIELEQVNGGKAHIDAEDNFTVTFDTIPGKFKTTSAGATKIVAYQVAVDFRNYAIGVKMSAEDYDQSIYDSFTKQKLLWAVE